MAHENKKHLRHREAMLTITKQGEAGLSERLREIRLNTKTSVEELTKVIGKKKDVEYIMRENHPWMFNISEMAGIARFYGMSISFLLFNVDTDSLDMEDYHENLLEEE